MICSNKMVLSGPAAWGALFFHKSGQGCSALACGAAGNDNRRRDTAAISRERYFYFIKRVKRFGVREIPRLWMQRFFDARVGDEPHDGHDHIAGAGDPGLYERQRDGHGIDHQRYSGFPIRSN